MAQNDQTLMCLHRLLQVYGINISRYIEHLMNLEMDSTIILFNISHKILHFQIIRNFVVTYHWLFRNIDKSLILFIYKLTMYDFTEIVFTQNKNNVRLSKYSILFIILIVKTHENIWFNNLKAKYKPPFLGIIYLIDILYIMYKS